MKITRPFIGLALLACLFIFFLILISVVSLFVAAKFGNNAASAVRILTVMQDIFVFVVPAVLTALLSTRLPATMLRIDRLPSLSSVALTLVVILAAVPAMNLLIHLNESIVFPGALEEKLRALESQAQATVELMTSGTSIGSLIVMILIVGVLAGFSEELFFRGALQRLLGAISDNPHVAIWTAALIFSAIHFQFYGFVPRLLLGAFFGYLAVWSGSLWLPILAHAFNNSLAVLSMWLVARGQSFGDLAKDYGTDLSSVSQLVAVIISVLAVALGVTLLHRLSLRSR